MRLSGTHESGRPDDLLVADGPAVDRRPVPDLSPRIVENVERAVRAMFVVVVDELDEH